MPLVQAKCTNCGANLEVDSIKDAAICPYCGTPYIVEKAINHFNTTNNISANVVNVYGGNPANFEIQAGVLIKYRGPQTNIIIPQNVKEIRPYSFEVGREYITSIVLPDGLQEISDYTFKDFRSLRHISIPGSVTRIGAGAFFGCSSLEAVNIPDCVTEIGRGAFINCINLKDVILSETAFKRLCPKICEEKIAPYDQLWGFKYTHSVFFWQWLAFSDKKIFSDSDVLNDTSIWFRGIAKRQLKFIETMNKENWRKCNRCQHCGGALKGVIAKKCGSCGIVRDY